MTKPLVAITGASSGIGEETARAFSALGHPLLLMARRTGRMEALSLPDCLSCEADVTDPGSFRRAVEAGQGRYGPIDCLVNNAGVMLLGRSHLQDPAEWERMVDVNLKGVLNGIHLVLDGMIRRGTGTIINIASVAGIKPGPNLAVYSGTKFAVRAVSESIREEAAPHGVRVCLISPGLVETELLDHTTAQDLRESYRALREPMGGFLDPQDVSRAILYAYQQPPDVCVREIVLAATRQLR